MKRILLAILMIISSPAWAVTNWNKSIPASGDNLTAWPAAVVSQWSILDTILSNYVRGEGLIYKNSTTLTVSSGEVVVSNSGASLRIFLQDASNTDITSSNLDTGSSFSSSTTYYVYAGTSSATAASSTYYISLSSSAPTGITYYKLIASFFVNASGNIDTIYNYNNFIGGNALGESGSYLSGTTYQNTTSNKIQINGYFVISTGNPGTFLIGQTSIPSSELTEATTNTGTIHLPFSCIVPIGWYWVANNATIKQVIQIN